jgi:hypothetical protein
MASIAKKDLLLMNLLPMKYLRPQITACLTVILSISGFQLTSIASEKDTYSMLETPKDVNSVPSDAEADRFGSSLPRAHCGHWLRIARCGRHRHGALQRLDDRWKSL